MSLNSLFQAIRENNTEAVRELIAEGVDVNYGGDASPLVFAIKYAKDKKIIKMLVEAGADVNYGSALTLASEKHDLELVKYLISQGANFDEFKMSPETILLQLILEQLIELNKKNDKRDEIETRRWNGLEKKIGEMEEKVKHLEYIWEKDEEKRLENRVLDELQIKIEKMRPKVDDKRN